MLRLNYTSERISIISLNLINGERIPSNLSSAFFFIT